MTEDERDAAEADRAAAEEGRVEAEDDRVDAEMGEGGQTLERGRVQAEEARVVAEEKREEHLRKWLGRYATIIALTVALISLVPSVVGLLWLHHEINNRCEDSAVNRMAIRQTIIDGLSSLGYQYVNGKIVPDGPPLDYYATHPEERAAQLVQAKATLQRFSEVDCGK